MLTVFLLVACIIYFAYGDSALFSEKQEHLTSIKTKWLEYEKSSHDPSRHDSVHKVLSKISGIYLDKSRVSGTRLDKTVLINVIETRDNEQSNEKYKQFLKNLLCYTKAYEFESVVYLIEPNATKFDRETKELQNLNRYVHTLPYPYEMFWNLVGKKNSTFHEGIGKGDYLGSIPTFKHFGAFVMLVPILEALVLGYNVIFFDVDVALVRDPLPYMITGNADFIVSPEMRVCVFPSLIPTTDWNALEPNTGTMHVRSTPAGIKFFQEWLSRIVEENSLNDQRVVNFERETNAERVSNCDVNNLSFEEKHMILNHENSQFARQDHMTASFGSSISSGKTTISSSISNNSATNNISFNSSSNSTSTFRYCYLNEFMFQNGLMEFYCRIGKRGASIGAYMLGMKYKSLSKTSVVNHVSERQSILAGLTVPDTDNNNQKKERIMYTPATLHVNFCVTKRKGLEDRGLWLYHHSSGEKKLDKDGSTVTEKRLDSERCSAYNIHKTHFAHHNWTEKIAHAEVELTNAVKNMNESEVVNFPKHGTVYLYENASLHMIPNKETFLARGYDFDTVKTLKSPIYWLLPYGSDLPSVV